MITIPMIPFVTLLLILSLIISPIPVIGTKLLDNTERLITKFAIWRNNLPVVKNAYDKAHLFDYIKG
jgi:hypothetical protein